MKHIKISVAVMVLSLLASLSFGAQSAVTSIEALGTSAKLGDLRGAVNTKLGTVESNRQDHETRVAALESLIGARPWVIQTTAPADTTLLWFDSDQVADAIVFKVHNGTAWVQQAIGEGGSYTLPTATADTLGGIKVGSRLTITDGVLSADVQTTDISGKQDTLVSGTNIKTVNGSSILGSGDLTVGEGGGIAHATSDGNYYASRNGAWASLAGVFAASLGVDDNYVTDAEKVKLSNLSGTNTGDQTTITGNAGSATVLQTARTIGGVSFNGSANINLPGVNTAGNQNTTGTAAGLTAQYIDWSASSGGSSIANKPTLGTSAQYDVGTAVGNIVRLGDDGSGNAALPFTLDLMDLTSGGTAINPPGTSGYALTANTSGVITWAAMSGGLASTDIDTSAELRAILTDEVGTGAAYFVGGALGTPASVTLTNGTGLPVSGITSSTSTALGLGSVELGHASDTTIARSSAGIATIEGVPITRTIVSGTSALGTSEIASGACASIVTTTATGTATTDVIEWGFNTRISQVTGYSGATTGALRIDAYPTANNVNFEVCNTTAAAITPGAVTLNWAVRR